MSLDPKDEGMALADQIERWIMAAVRTSRNQALDTAIAICQDCVKDGDSAETCLKMLRDLKGMMNPKMDS